MQQLAVTSQSRAANPCWDIPVRRLCLLCQKTHRLVWLKTSNHPMSVWVKGVCVFCDGLVTFPASILASGDALRSLVVGWLRSYMNNTFWRKLTTQIQIKYSPPTPLSSLWHHPSSSYPRICLILFIATLQFKDFAGFLSRCFQLRESQRKHSLNFY